ncbi:hypothetical protein [Herbiconiux daphne]|uniref:Thioredoxin domain-containing protein n=1 Tax=Herbiconiux daphne TaxID=2970914 RepID=A0ABT2H1V0_9MICO|nr:hypothetical protein [Herbiconiux daphne]MCS5733892.1 hypothetical protein [Herbiconiux daphne]
MFEGPRTTEGRASADGPWPAGWREQTLERLTEVEDTTFGGFGGPSKFVNAPAILLLQRLDAERSATRALSVLAASPLRDASGGFSAAAALRDWNAPRPQLPLDVNGLLLDAFLVAAAESSDVATRSTAMECAAGIAWFVRDALRLDSGGFASGIDRETERRDLRVETAGTGLAVRALSRAATVLREPRLLDAAVAAIEFLLTRHRYVDGRLARSSIEGRLSGSSAGLADYALCAAGLIAVTRASGDPGFADAARDLVAVALAEPRPDGTPVSAVSSVSAASSGSAVSWDPSVFVDTDDGARPSGGGSLAGALLDLAELTRDESHIAVARSLLARVPSEAVRKPLSYATALEQACRLAHP